jgi:hypothetical protein
MQKDNPPRSEAIGRLVELGLTVKSPAAGPVRKPARAASAAELAANASTR